MCAFADKYETSSLVRTVLKSNSTSIFTRSPSRRMVVGSAYTVVPESLSPSDIQSANAGPPLSIRSIIRRSRVIEKPLQEIGRNAVGTGAVCSRLWESSNETWSGFAAPCGGDGLVATGSCEECRRVYCEYGAGVGVKVGFDRPPSAVLEPSCLTLLRESLGFGNLRRSHAACECPISLGCCRLLLVTCRVGYCKVEPHIRPHIVLRHAVSRV